MAREVDITLVAKWPIVESMIISFPHGQYLKKLKKTYPNPSRHFGVLPIAILLFAHSLSDYAHYKAL